MRNYHTKDNLIYLDDCFVFIKVEENDTDTPVSNGKDAFDKLGGRKIPTIKELDEEFQTVLSKKKAAYSEYREAKNNMTKFQIAKYDIDRILGITEDKDPVKETQRESVR